VKRLVLKKKEAEKVEIEEIPEERLVNVSGYSAFVTGDAGNSVVVRTFGSFEYRAFSLDDAFDWEIGIDEHGDKILVPLKKRQGRMELKKLVIKKKEEGEVEEIPEDRLCWVKLKDHYRVLEINNEGVYMAERADGDFKDRAIYLHYNYDWVLGKDNMGNICLVPLKKGEEGDV